MTLEELRKKAIYQNTIDAWIAACEEKNHDWYETEDYKKFISYLKTNQLKMQKFPLCVKETVECMSVEKTRQNLQNSCLHQKTKTRQHTQLN